MSKYLQVIEARRLPNNTATATFNLVVPPEFCSRAGMLHGGAASMMVDMATTLCQAPTASPGFWEFGGVSRTLK